MKSAISLIFFLISLSAFAIGGSGFGGDSGGSEEEIVVKPTKLKEESEEITLGKSCLASMGGNQENQELSTKKISEEIKKNIKKKKEGRSIASLEKNNMNFDCHLFAKITKDKELIDLIAPREVESISIPTAPTNSISK